MLTSVKGYYEKGRIVLTEQPFVADRTDVIVTFLTEQKGNDVIRRIPGALKGKVTLPDNFNEPLEDLKDYM